MMTETTTEKTTRDLGNGWIVDAAIKNLLWVSEPYTYTEGPEGGWREALHATVYGTGNGDKKLIQLKVGDIDSVTVEITDDGTAEHPTAAYADPSVLLDDEADDDYVDWNMVRIPVAALPMLIYALAVQLNPDTWFGVLTKINDVQLPRAEKQQDEFDSAISK